LHLPVCATRDERELRNERGESDARPCELSTLAEVEHDGDVNGLQFVSARDENLLISASSAGGVFAFRVSSTTGDGDANMADGEPSKPLTAFAIPHWEKVFADTAATCVEASENRTSLVTASAGGALAWLKLDDAVSIEKIENKDTSSLPINAVKFLGRDSVVATVGSTPGSQLRIWDLTANNQFPVTTCTDILTTLETHPTRPELLITGANDGHVSFWDRRKLDVPFRTEAYHQRAIRALKLHSASPQYLYSGGDDTVVNCWDFHHGRNPRDPGPGALQVQALATGSQPWNALEVHAESDTLVAGSDAQSMVIVQHASKWMK
ncbi:putative nuclear migration facilitating protein Pac1, partial [Phytophthora palmivora]